MRRNSPYRVEQPPAQKAAPGPVYRRKFRFPESHRETLKDREFEAAKKTAESPATPTAKNERTTAQNLA
jgi:hypothetical protein